MKKLLALISATLAPLALAQEGPPTGPQKVEFLVTWTHPMTNVAFRVYQRVLPDGVWSATNTPVGIKEQAVAFDPNTTNEVAVTAVDDLGFESDPATAQQVVGNRPSAPASLGFVPQGRVVIIVP